MTKKSILQAAGKRKTSIARVLFKEGKGKIMVNGKNFNDYFPIENQRVMAVKSLAFFPIEDKYDVFVNVRGGGLNGQAGAIKLAIAHLLLLLNPELKITLSKAGMLTRDSRIKERKKYGQKGARARFQFSKR